MSDIQVGLFILLLSVGCSRGGEIECLSPNGDLLFRGHYDKELNWGYQVNEEQGVAVYSKSVCHLTKEHP